MIVYDRSVDTGCIFWEVYIMEKKFSVNDVKVFCKGDHYKIKTPDSMSGKMDLATACWVYKYMTGQTLSAYDVVYNEWPAFELAAR